MMRAALVTGAAGFVGKALYEKIRERGWKVRGTVLTGESVPAWLADAEVSCIDPIGPDTEWEHLLQGLDAVVHLAARVHVMRDSAADPIAEFRRTNVEGTRCLAQSAAKAGIKHFIYVSSVMVNGAGSQFPYTELDEPRPKDPYGVSKWEAEQALRAISGASSLKVTILRPPLVYGPGVKANFLKLIETVCKGMPLPLASISNRRSLIYVGNLADAITSCLDRPEVSANTYLVSDGDDVSTPELIRRTAAALKRPARLFPFPSMVMRAAGRLFGQSASVERLTESLTVDIAKLRGELSWSPPYTMAEGLKKTAEWYLARIPQRNSEG